MKDKIRVASGSEDEVSVLDDFQVDQFCSIWRKNRNVTSAWLSVALNWCSSVRIG